MDNIFKSLENMRDLNMYETDELKLMPINDAKKLNKTIIVLNYKLFYSDKKAYAVVLKNTNKFKYFESNSWGEKKFFAKKIIVKNNNLKIKFNCLKGKYGFVAIDTVGSKAHFINWYEILDSKVHKKQIYKIRFSINYNFSIDFLNDSWRKFRATHSNLYFKNFRNEVDRYIINLKFVRAFINNIKGVKENV